MGCPATIRPGAKLPRASWWPLLTLLESGSPVVLREPDSRALCRGWLALPAGTMPGSALYPVVSHLPRLGRAAVPAVVARRTMISAVTAIGRDAIDAYIAMRDS